MNLDMESPNLVWLWQVLNHLAIQDFPNNLHAPLLLLFNAKMTSMVTAPLLNNSTYQMLYFENYITAIGRGTHGTEGIR